MLNRITFYFRQASANLKRSILIIISISIAISMVAGALYYSNSYEEKELHDAFTAMPDLSVSVTSDQINFTTNLNNNYPTISQAITRSGLDITNSFKYGFLDSDSCYIYQNYNNNSEVSNASSNNFKRMLLNVFIADSNFYNTRAFSNHFTLLAGKLPTNRSEILMDNTTASYFNYHVGESLNLTAYYGTMTEIISSYTISNITISGIYSPIFTSYSILGRYYSDYFNYQLHEYETGNSSSIVPSFTSPIFSYKSFSNPIENNPFQQFSDSILNENIYSDQSSLMDKIGYKFGVGIQIDKKIIHFSNMNSTNYQMKNQINILSKYIPQNFISINYISPEIATLIRNTYNPIFTLLIFIIPFLIFAFVIGSLSVSNISSRFDEFFLLESKGTPKRMIRNQMLLETLFIGIISATTASLFGIATFSIYKKLLGTILFTNINQTILNFPLYINWDSIGIIFLISIVLSLFTGVSGIIAMNKVEIPELLNSMGEDGVTVEYDESTLFGMNKSSNLPGNEKYENITRKRDLKSIEKQEKLNKNKDTSEIAQIKTNLKYYKDHIKRTQKKIPKVSYIYIIISLFPIVLYYLATWGMQPNAPDILFYFHRFLTYSVGSLVIAIFFIISPIFMAVGLIRFLTKESPSRYAKISRFLSRPFLKAKSYLIGFEMIKRKKLRKIIYIIGIFISLLVLSNFLFSSESRYPIIVNNLSIGADVKITANTQNGMYNTSYNQILDNNLRNITTAKGAPLVTNTLIYYEQNEASGQNVYYFNFANYLKIIQEGDKFVPKGLVANISKTIAYDNNASNKYPGTIVSQSFLAFNNYEIGDLIFVNHAHYDAQLNKTIYTPITLKIVASYDVLPGISVNGYNPLTIYQGIVYFGSGQELAIDSNVFNQSSQLLKINTINQLVDLNLKAESNDTIITGLIKDSTSTNQISYSSFSYYDQQWNSPLVAGTISTSGFYGLIYFEFMILGIILSIGLASLLNSFQSENKYFFGLLMSRGFGKKGIFNFMLSQLIIIFLLAFISGIFSGVIPSIVFIKMSLNIMNPYWSSLGMPIFFNSISLLVIMGLIFGISFAVYIGTYYIQTRKSISQYMRKF